MNLTLVLAKRTVSMDGEVAGVARRRSLMARSSRPESRTALRAFHEMNFSLPQSCLPPGTTECRLCWSRGREAPSRASTESVEKRMAEELGR